MKAEKYKWPPAMKYLLLPFYGTYLKRKYGLTLVSDDEKSLDILLEKGGGLVFSNHVHTLDPFLISAVFPYHIRWVAGAYLFKMKAVGYLLRNWVGCISKSQGKNDLGTIRAIKNALEENTIVGVFPEGTRSWDGEMMDITTGSAKIMKIFRRPVVIINIEGGYNRKPRWAKSDRKGNITIRVKRILSCEELEEMSISDVEAVLRENLSFSSSSWQKENRMPFEGRKRAEGIERLLYYCPYCLSAGTVSSNGNMIACSSCKTSAEVSVYDEIISEYGMMSERDAHIRAREELERNIGKNDGSLLFPPERGILFQKEEKGRLVKLSSSFIFSMTAGSISFSFSNHKEGAGEISFPFSEISALVINARQSVEFTHMKNTYRFRLEETKSPLKVFDAYCIIRGGN